MAIIKTGTFSVTSGGTAQNLTLGFIPSYFRAYNDTSIASPGNTKIASFEWYSSMPNASAYIRTYNGSNIDLLTKITTNGVTPFQTTDSSLWTVTRKTITGITKAANAQVTSTAHGFTSADVGVTTVTFHGVVGMTQINTLTGVIQSIVDANNFTVNINTTSFTSYTSGGQANVITGSPASTTSGFQIFNTPQKNAGLIGLTFGTTLMATTSDLWRYEAVLDTPVTS